MRTRHGFAAAMVMGMGVVTGSPCAAQTAAGSAFTYQGLIEDSGVPLTCLVDLRCSLFDALTGDTQQCSTQQLIGVNVVQGRFTVTLDYGASMFNGQARWLEVQVRYPAGTGAWTVLSPRQAITPTPYAIYALNAPAGGVGPQGPIGPIGPIGP